MRDINGGSNYPPGCSGTDYDEIPMHPSSETLWDTLAELEVPEADIIAADAILTKAIEEWPEGHLVRTSTEDGTVVMLSWQSEEYGKDYLKPVWERG